MNIKKALLLLFLFTLFSCRDVEVSINPSGQTAFCTQEGVFSMDFEAAALTTLYWNRSRTETPHLVRWNPEGTLTAYTLENNSTGSTEVYIVPYNGRGRTLIFQTPKSIAALEWSPDGSYLSAAVEGRTAADLVLIETRTGVSRYLATGTADAHVWKDANQLLYFSFSVANSIQSTEFYADLVALDVETGNKEILTRAVVQNPVSIDYYGGKTLFTALAAGEETTAYSPRQNSTKSIYMLTEDGLSKLSQEEPIAVVFSPDGNNILYTADTTPSTLNIIELETNYQITATDRICTMIGDQALIPGWKGNSEIFYWVNSAAFSSNTERLRLMSIDLVTYSKTNRQLLIDSGINQLTLQYGGY